jgi:hypothetical protein
MEGEMSKATKYVVGPTGQVLTVADLPPANTTRWVVRRKAEVVHAVKGGLLSLPDALERYNLTHDEYQNWDRQLSKHGAPGMRVTRCQEYRD